MSPSDRVSHPSPDSTSDPTPEEVAAIIAAVEVAWPRPAASDERETPPAWRFSGRWWAKPIASRRDRPAG